MDEAMSFVEILSGLGTLVFHMFLIFLMVLVFFAGVAVCLCVVLWDSYECHIRDFMAKARVFFAEHIWRVSSMF